MSEYQTTERSPDQHYVEPGEEVTNVEPARATSVTYQIDGPPEATATIRIKKDNAGYWYTIGDEPGWVTVEKGSWLHIYARRLLEPKVPEWFADLKYDLEKALPANHSGWSGVARVAVRFAVEKLKEHHLDVATGPVLDGCKCDTCRDIAELEREIER